MRVEQTLLGKWALIREWGRIGDPKGQRLEEWFDTEELAQNTLSKIEARKRRKGYKPTSHPGDSHGKNEPQILIQFKGF